MSNNSLNKKDFFLGFFAGVALTAIIALGVTVFVQMNGGLPATGNSKVVVNNTNDGPANADEDPLPPTPTLSEVPLSEEDHSRGSLDAPITIVEYSDFQCPYCQRFHETMIRITEEYPDQVRWVYKHFPLDGIHPYARDAAEASECAADQGKFWEYADGLYENQSQISLSYLSTLAAETGLDTVTFQECLDSGKYADKVEDQFAEGIALGVRGTPGTFLNGKDLGGAAPYAQVKSLIDMELGQ